MDELRGKLGKLAGHAAVAAEVDARIARQSAERIDAIRDRLAELAPSALTSKDAEDEYLRLVEERGRLQQMVARLRT